MAKSFTQEFVRGLWEEIPPFRLVLGLCPVLGVTTTMENGIGMGLATTFVLLCSNILVSALRNIIPSKVRIACFIIIIATFVIVPLIVVNCIVLGRAEAFASKNSLLPSIADGLGIGIGFTLSLAALGALREVIGTGTFYGAMVFGPSFKPFTFMVQAPGAFVCLGLMLCVMNLFESK